MTGQRLLHYEITGKLGEGGMGVVYKARDTHLDRFVAIKVLPAEKVADPERKRRFVQEAKAASALNHPHIITIYDISSDGGRDFIAMEYVPGKTLDLLIGREGLPLNAALKYAIQIADALARAHAAGIVHRDLKPSNIMVDEHGHVKVLDFGLAKLTEPAGPSPDAETRTMKASTEEGVIVGTVAYMSPEQAEGRAVDPRSDIFSFGAVLYELLSGRRAFRRETMSGTLAAVIAQEPLPLKEAPARVARIVAKMLAKKRESRYKSAEELLADLRKAAQPGAGILSRRLWLALAAGLMMAVAVVLGLERLIGRMKAPAPSIRLAVLPFANLSGDPEQEYLTDGLTQEMITQLGSLHPASLSVIARTSVMRYKKSDKSIDQVGRELGVDYILEGSARREARQVRITAELIQVRNQAQLWAESFERDLAGILALQSEVARKVAGSLALKLLPAEQARLASARTATVNPEAYEALLMGMHKWNPTPQGLDAALEYYELALKKDPNYAPAHLAVATVWVWRNQCGYTAPREAGPKAKAAVLKALELDNTLADGHGALAWVNFLYEWDWAGAEVEWKRAIELNPNYGDSVYSQYLMVMERPEEAMAQMQRALQFDPLNETVRLHHAFELQSAGRDDEVIVQARKLLRTSPQHPMLHGMLSVSFLHKGRYEESLSEMKASYSSIGDREVEEALTQGYAQSGYRGAMRCAADLLAARSRKTYVSSIDVALLYALAGENAQALDWLDKCLEERSPHMPYVGAYVEFEPLRNTPRFKAILRRMNLPQ